MSQALGRGMIDDPGVHEGSGQKLSGRTRSCRNQAGVQIREVDLGGYRNGGPWAEQVTPSLEGASSAGPDTRDRRGCAPCGRTLSGEVRKPQFSMKCLDF